MFLIDELLTWHREYFKRGETKYKPANNRSLFIKSVK